MVISLNISMITYAKLVDEIRYKPCSHVDFPPDRLRVYSLMARTVSNTKYPAWDVWQTDMLIKFTNLKPHVNRDYPILKIVDFIHSFSEYLYIKII